ncbi:hypothetical protein QFC19_007998 [Naganishia cerealis]|uniref:Uncharacterized protein n=1 Tax=Naganishia cerealis TaxID=610337 RepID=A0ACC2V4L9_9TREE|nr:hypothetical protein QFC19_007998 [Naganishia cerealis]
MPQGKFTPSFRSSATVFISAVVSRPQSVDIKHAGKAYKVEFDTSKPATDFKDAIYQVTGVPSDRMKVMIASKLLKDTDDLSKFAIKPGQVVTVIGTAGPLPSAPSKPVVFLEDMPESQLAAIRPPLGLQNLGNTCYMNASLQAIRTIPELDSALREYRSSGPSGADKDAAFTQSLKTLFGTMREKTVSQDYVVPLLPLTSLRQVAPQFQEQDQHGGYAQQGTCCPFGMAFHITADSDDGSITPRRRRDVDANHLESPSCTPACRKLEILRRSIPQCRFAADVSLGYKFDVFDNWVLICQTVGSLRLTCDEAPEEPPTTKVDRVLKLDCNISIETNHLMTGIKDSFDQKIEKNSPSLGRTAVYTQKSRLSRLPTNLTIHMVRFYWRADIQKKAKIMRRVEFPFELDVFDLLSDDLKKLVTPIRDAVRESQKAKEDRAKIRRRTHKVKRTPTAPTAGSNSDAGSGSVTPMEVDKLEDEGTVQQREREKIQELTKQTVGEENMQPGTNWSGLYELSAIVTHKGPSADSGHYIAWARQEPRDDVIPGEEDWYKFDDDKVSIVKKDKIQALAGGGEDSVAAFDRSQRRAALRQSEVSKELFEVPATVNPNGHAVPQYQKRCTSVWLIGRCANQWQQTDCLNNGNICLNAITTNGVYAWPQYGPVVIEKLGMTVTQGQTIVLGGICGTYLMAAPVGRLCDVKGPRFASTLSAILSFLGYQGFAYILARGSVPFVQPDEYNPNLDKQATPVVLAIAYFLVGAAAIGSYFSVLTTATLNFPKYPTLALSVPLSFLGLSSLFLSSLGRIHWFQDELLGDEHGTELNPVKFLRMLGFMIPIVNIFSAMFLIVIPPSIPEDLLPEEDLDPAFIEDMEASGNQATAHEENDVDDDMERPDLSRSFMSYRSAVSEDLRHLTERTPLLIGGPEALYAAVREEEGIPSPRSRSHSKASSHRAPLRTDILSGMRDVNVLESQTEEVRAHEHTHWNTKMLLKNKGLWGFGVILVLAIGPAEMTLTSIGSILDSILASHSRKHPNVLSDFFVLQGSNPARLLTTASSKSTALALRSKHILFLSISSTLARLIVGAAADYLSPIVISHSEERRRRIGAKRSTLTVLCMAIETAVFVYAAAALETEKGLTVLSLGIGAMYGAIFTLTPAITSKHFGPAHFGLSWGMLSYFSAFGSVLYSYYLFAVVSEYEAGRQAGEASLDMSSTFPSDPPSQGEEGLRQRLTATSTSHDQPKFDTGIHHTEDASAHPDKDGKAQQVYGKTPDGTVFTVPPTHSFVHTLSHTIFTSHLTILTLLTFAFQFGAFIYLPPWARSPFFFLYFAFWRAAYDAGLGWVLRKQSEKKWIVKQLRKWGWLERAKEGVNGDIKNPWASWWKKELETKMGHEGYRWDQVPEEFNAWLMFRQVVDIILLNDFLSYSLFACTQLHFPQDESVLSIISRWIFGWALIVANIFIKIDAHKAIGNYSWYWGDTFWQLILQEELVFDGVYEVAPHPMYSSKEEAIAATQNIERTYGGGKKPIAGKTHSGTWAQLKENATSAVSNLSVPGITTPAASIANGDATPSVTEGETDSDWDDRHEATTPQSPSVTLPDALDSMEYGGPATVTKATFGNDISSGDTTVTTSMEPSSISGSEGNKLSLKALTIKYLQKPVVIFSNIDMFRSNDFLFVLLIAYAVLPNAFGKFITLRPALRLTLYYFHALLWRLFHSFGLGLLLRAQSKSRWMVRHFLKHYHYATGSSATAANASNGQRMPGRRRVSLAVRYGMDTTEDDVQAATKDAFDNWKVIYNTSLVMTYISFGCLAWKIYSIPSDWTVGGQLLRHTLGFLLIALHLWSAASSYEVLGDFGWLYSDFFLEQYAQKLAYTGIYRFLNNPERSMGGAAFLGLALISGSKMVATLAFISHLCHLWFLSFVESPHMRRLYGDSLRKDGGVSKTFKNVAEKHAKSLETKAGKHAPEIKRVMSGVKQTMTKMEDKVTEAVEEFLDLARPRLSEVVEDTKYLLQRSRERMIITRVASDADISDRSQYALVLPSGSNGPVQRYHVGQPIRVSWNAPSTHSKKDWIGIYRLGSCKDELVTKISSVGKWIPIYDEEWDGSTPLSDVTPAHRRDADAGTVVFEKERLPWKPGKYEIRYHHDGKHNVMTKVAPVEIYVPKMPASADLPTTRQEVAKIVCFAVDLDPKLVPRSAQHFVQALEKDSTTNVEEIEIEDDLERSFDNTLDAEAEQDESDDFAIMDEDQAKRIAAMLEAAFDVELATAVILANTNVSVISRRIIGARSLAITSNSASG